MVSFPFTKIWVPFSYTLTLDSEPRTLFLCLFSLCKTYSCLDECDVYPL